MKANPVVSKRFRELADKATAIADAKTLHFGSRDDGKEWYNIDAADFSGWAASVLNLLQRVFGRRQYSFPTLLTRCCQGRKL
jgi:hypothetical protein